MKQLAELLAICGASALVLAAIAWTGDLRRARRKDLDRVGIMPWTPLFFLSLMAAVVFLGIAAQMWLAD